MSFKSQAMDFIATMQLSIRHSKLGKHLTKNLSSKARIPT